MRRGRLLRQMSVYRLRFVMRMALNLRAIDPCAASFAAASLQSDWMIAIGTSVLVLVLLPCCYCERNAVAIDAPMSVSRWGFGENCGGGNRSMSVRFQCEAMFATTSRCAYDAMRGQRPTMLLLPLLLLVDPTDGTARVR